MSESSSTDNVSLDIDQLGAWLRTLDERWVPPLTATVIAGGRSNLTYRVVDQRGKAMVLRRPPLGQVQATAHDVLREYRIIDALAPTAVPVPAAVASCEDPSVIGAPFYLMRFVAGTVVDGPEKGANLAEDAKRRCGIALAETLAELHDVDTEAIGLGDLGRPDGYVERQLHRLWEQVQRLDGRAQPELEAVHHQLAESVPPQATTSLVHGDYRLGNVIVDDAGDLQAVLDWELCTRGDPLADLGFMICYWPEHPSALGALPFAANTSPGFATRSELITAYQSRRRVDLSALPFYVAFGYWRLACIVEGVYARYARGAYGDQGVDLAALGSRPKLLADMAADTAASI